MLSSLWKVSGDPYLESMNPLVLWLRPTLFLFNLDVVQKAYDESYKLLPKDIQNILGDKKLGYLGDVWRSLDLLLCMHAYRDLQYGPKGIKRAPMLRKRVKLSWIAYNINAAQKLLDHWDRLEEELWAWYDNEGHQYRDRKTFRDFIDFLHGYIQTTIAELAVLYVYLYNNRTIMPLGFMQHPVTLGPSGPALGDFIDIETLTFIEVKSQRLSRANYRYYKSYLLSLAINTRLPSAIAVPRYRVDKEKGLIDTSDIVIEFYTLAAAGNRQWIEHNENKDLDAPIEDYLKPLIQNISILRNNADDYLREVTRQIHQQIRAYENSQIGAWFICAGFSACMLIGLLTQAFSFYESPRKSFEKLSHDNPSGWGIAWFNDEGWHIHKEPQPLYLSDKARDLVEKRIVDK